MLRNKYLIAALGAVLLVVAAYNISFFRTRTSHKDAGTPALAPADSGRQRQKTLAPPQALNSRSAEEWRRDPFWYPGGARRTTFPASGARAPKAERGLRLEGTTMKEDKSYALISGKVYGVGDRIAGQEIVAISDSSVTMKGAGGVRTMSILTRSTEKE